MLVGGVDVATGGVALPDLDQRVAHRLAVGVEDAAGDDDPLAQRLARVLAGEIGVLRAHRDASEGGTGRGLEPLVGEADQRPLGRAQHRRAVVRVQIRRLELHLHQPGQNNETFL